ncbi:hypothetical protein POL68_23930 [Stigmatella sp. ncwal1]|uniref:Uncharacterized protein n=1 Tax=Stigmatella ashevillensis TaxID=2995309 RepID=A0ABT5DGQ7_9BACT|nr:hypothetical protein [Stigmatella ashevillena]MDC0711541.1 hypothetical protein [Stigmatella ashevillena]
MTSIRSNSPSNVPPRPKEDKPEAKPVVKAKPAEAKEPAAKQPVTTAATEAAKKDAFATQNKDAAQPLDLLRDTSSQISAATTARPATDSAVEDSNEPVDLAAVDAAKPSPLIKTAADATTTEDAKIGATAIAAKPAQELLSSTEVKRSALATDALADTLEPVDLAAVDAAKPSPLIKTAADVTTTEDAKIGATAISAGGAATPGTPALATPSTGANAVLTSARAITNPAVGTKTPAAQRPLATGTPDTFSTSLADASQPSALARDASVKLGATSLAAQPPTVAPEEAGQPVDLAAVGGQKPNVLIKTGDAPNVDAPNVVRAAADPSAVTAVPEDPIITGEQRAQQEVDVKTVADDRAETETLHQNIKDGTSQKTEEIFSMTAEGATLPPNVSVTKHNDNQVELVRLDESGKEIERTFATRNADGTMQLDSRSFADNTNQRDVVEVNADGSTSVKSASWQSTESQAAQNTPSFEQLEQSRDRNVKINEQRIGQKDADGNWVAEGGTLSTDQYAQADGAVKGSQTSFSSQQGLGGVDDKLKGNFADQNGTVDRATTHTYTVHPPGEDGTQPLPEYERIERFSQGEAQATSYVNAELSTDTNPVMIVGDGVPVMSEDDHVDYEATVGTQNHSREDLNNLRTKHENFWQNRYDANDAGLQGQTPKRWLAENKDDANTYESQTFVEGAPNASIVTRRELQADNTVTETYAGKTFSPDPNSDDLVDVKGTSTTQYGDDGMVAQSSFQRTQADGSVEDGTYSRTREQTADGLLVTEHAEGNVTQPDGKKSSSITDRQTRETDEGKELIRSSQAVIEDGKRVTHELTQDGEKLLTSAADGTNAVEISDASQFEQPFEENLAATAAATNLTNVKGLTDAGAIFTGLREGQITKAQALLGSNLDNALTQTASAYRTAGIGLGAGGGVLGASAAAASMMDAVKTKNNLGIAAASIGLGGAAADMGSAASVMKGAIGKFGGMLGIAGAALGNVSNILGGVDSIMTSDKTGLEGQRIKGITNVVTGGLGLAALAMGSPVLALGFGVVGLGVNAIVELITDDAHQIGELKIDDPNYRPSLEEAAPPPPAQTPEEVPPEYWGATWNLW